MTGGELSDAVDRMATVFGWQHLAKYSGMSSEWLSQTLDAMARCALHAAEARVAAVEAERDEAREDLRKLREHKIGDPEMAAMHGHANAKAHVEALNAYDRVTGGAPLSTSLAWAIEHGSLRPDRALNAEVERLTAEVKHWKDHAQEAGEGFTQVCRDAARISARNVELSAQREAGLALADHWVNPACDTPSMCAHVRCGHGRRLRAVLGGTE